MCPEVTNIPHASLDILSVEYGTKMTITCDKGYYINDNSTCQHICNENGEWDPPLKPCVGEF